jgi:Ni/Fe-hydrogenase subunit HybB-like protein
MAQTENRGILNELLHLPTSYFIMAALAAFGLALGVYRMVVGLGSTTNLSDAYPWGLWIVYDVFFIPFSAGAFMISAVTHIYDKEEYHVIARPVVLAGFVGYLFVVLVLLMDLGRWHKFYNILNPWYWNPHSFMFEVSMCITAYTGVLVMEVAPTILERLNWRKPLRLLRVATVLIAGVGIVLSSLHQSSLGSLFLLMRDKLHPLWWSPQLPLFFFTSAAFSGLSMAIFVAVVSFKAFGRRLRLNLLSDLAKIVFIMLGLYLALKVTDLAINGELGLIFSDGWLSFLFAAEMLLGVIAPMFIFGNRQMRQSGSGLFQGSGLVLVGLGLNRINVALLALQAPPGPEYFPHWIELVISLAAIVAGVLIFGLAARFLPIFQEAEEVEAERSLSDSRSEERGWAQIPQAERVDTT